jgi:uncharacterized protein (TIRG00374 family)
VLSYSAAELLALLPFTPDGLDFVEAGLVGTLTVAGVPGSDALAATLLYRLAAYWLPIPAGASRTCCSATATTDAMRLWSSLPKRHAGRQATNGFASSVQGRRW